MQTTSTSYKAKILEASRSFQCRITIGSVVLTNDDIVDIILDTPQPSDGFMIGSTTSQALDLTIINKGNTIYSANQVKVEIGLNIGTDIEYILMGYYNIDEVVKTDYTIKFTCYDNMIKFETPYITNYGDTPTLQQVINDLISITGVQFIGSLPSYTVKKLEGFTCREVLSYVGSICGGNAVITRDGKFNIVYPTDSGRTITGSNYIDFKREDTPYKIGKITCQNGEDSLINKGTLGTDSMELSFENPWVTDTILTDIYNRLNGFTYLGYTMKWQGDLSLDPGDIITVTDVKGIVRKVPILSQKFTYTGGLTSEIGAKGESKNKNSFSSSGNTSKQVQRVVARLLLAEEAIISKANIQDLNAVSIRTQTLETKTASIETLVASKASITDLNVTNANIANLVAADVTINNLLAAKATIIDLNAAKARIGTLESSTADIGTIRSNLATITTLVNGNLTSNNIQSLVLTSDKVTVASGFIKNAMIENLDVSKINAGNISTNKFRIVSDSGKMVIADNTIQINDTNRTRVQIGKDASNDYNMYVWDSAGKLMFDATGLKADGVKAKIIRDDMISDTANINGSKININSLVTELNKDTNTSVIKASKVNIDLTGQTLEVAFNSLKSNVDGIEVGGRNLLLKSADMKPNVINYNWHTQSAIIGGADCIVVNTPSYSYRWCEGDLSDISITNLKSSQLTLGIDFKTNKNDILTFKFSVRTSPNTNSHDSKIITIPNTNDKWMRFYITMNMPTDGIVRDRMIYYIANATNTAINDTFSYRNIKLEKGNKSTDWTPAPEDVDSKIEANTTSINVEQGRINTLISDTTIIKGNVTSLSDNYSSLSQTVSGINSTVGSHTTSITTLSTNIGTAQTTANNANTLADSKAKVFTMIPTTPYKIGDIWTSGPSGELMKCKITRTTGSYSVGDWEKASKYTDDTKANAIEGNLNTLTSTVTTVQSKQTTLEQNLDGFKTTVSSTYVTKTDLSTTNGNVTSLTTRISNAESSITQQANSIALKVETSTFNTYKTTTTNDINTAKTGAISSAKTYTDTSVSTVDTKITSANSAITILQNQITSKVSQTDIDTSIKTINIGVRNLYKGTKDFNSSFWAAILALENYELDTTCKQATITSYYANLTTSTALQGFDFSDITKTWTISAMFKADTVGQTIGITLSGARVGWQQQTVTNGSWKKLSWTFAGDGAPLSSFRFQNDALIGTIKVAQIKIEEGNKATDWIVAPEDVQGQIDNTNSNVVALTTRVTSAESSITQHTNSIALKVATTDFNTYKTTNDSAVASKASQTSLNATNTNVTSLTTRITSAESTLTIQAGQIATKVTQSDINTSINSIEVGGRNLLKNSKATITVIGTGDGTTEKVTITTLNVDLVAGQQYTFSCKTDGAWGTSTSLATDTVEAFLLKDGTYVYYISMATNPFTFTPTTSGNFKIRLDINKNNTTHNFWEFKVEKGNKATDWTPAPEDVDKQIADVVTSTDTKISTAKTEIKQTTDGIALNVTNLQSTTNTLTTQMGNKVETSEYNTTKNTVAAHAVKLTGITSTVSASISTAKTEAINSANGTTDTKLASYSTTTQMNTAITQSATSIASSVSNTYLSKQAATDIYGAKTDIANTYATKSLVTQTDDAWKATFNESGGYNLINNSCFIHDLTSWITVGSPTVTVNSTSSGYGKAVKLITTANSQMISQVISNLATTSRKYTLSCYVYVTAGNCVLQVVNGTETLEAISSTLNGWQWLVITFTPKAATVTVNIGKSTNGVIGTYIATAVMLQTGSTRSPWSPNSNELKNGNTIINADGVTINGGALVVKNNNNTVIIDGQSDMHKITVTGTIAAKFSGSAGERVYTDIQIGTSSSYRPCFEVYFCDGGVVTSATTEKLPVYNYSIIFADPKPIFSKTHEAAIIYINGYTTLRITSTNYPGGGYVDNFSFRYYIYKEVSI